MPKMRCSRDSSKDASSRKSTLCRPARKPGMDAFLKSTGMRRSGCSCSWANANARLYSSRTQPDAIASGETIKATVLLSSNPASSAPTNRSPGRISSRSSHTLRPRAARASLRRLHHALSLLLWLKNTSNGFWGGMFHLPRPFLQSGLPNEMILAEIGGGILRESLREFLARQRTLSVRGAGAPHCRPSDRRL